MPAPRPPQQLRAKRTRKRLLNAARSVFTERGYAGASLDDVVGEAGCSKGAYYFHFASKEEVLLALVDAWRADRARRIDQAARRHPTPEIAVAALLGAVLTVDADGWQPQLAVEFWTQAGRSPEVAAALENGEHGRRQAIVQAFAGVGDGGALAPGLTPELAADLLVAVERGLIAQAAIDGDALAGAEGLARSLLTVITGRVPLRKAG